MTKYNGGSTTTESACGDKCTRDCKCLGFFYNRKSSRCWLGYELKTLTKTGDTSLVAYVKAPNASKKSALAIWSVKKGFCVSFWRIIRLRCPLFSLFLKKCCYWFILFYDCMLILKLHRNKLKWNASLNSIILIILPKKIKLFINLVSSQNMIYLRIELRNWIMNEFKLSCFLFFFFF